MTKEECEIETSKAIMEMRNHIAELEKEIAELEKENKELKAVKIPQLERKIASIRGAHSVDCKKLNARLEQVERLKKENAGLIALINAERTRQEECDDVHLRKIAELEKENTGLKARINAINLLTPELEKLSKAKKEQITKAKEIIESLLPFEHVIDPYALTSDIEENRKRFHEPFRKAEQFLKEVSE